MMSTGISETVAVLVVAPGREAEEVEVVAGTTVAELAGICGLPEAERLPAMNEMGEMMRPGDAITPESGAISFIFKLAGA